MDPRKYIFDKLAEKIRVAIVNDGYQSDKPEDDYDAQQACNLLEPFADYVNKVDSFPPLYDDYTDINPMLEQIKNIKKLIRTEAERLAKKALITNTDLSKVTDKTFDRLAKGMERKFKSQLTIVSFDLTLG